jgi:uncharacterized protein (TIGR02757 family)
MQAKSDENREAIFHALETVRDQCPAGFAEDADPVRFPRRFGGKADAEAAGWFAALLAYGRRELFLAVLDALFAVLPADLSGFLRAFDPDRDTHRFLPLRYRFNTGADLALSAAVLGRVLWEHADLEAYFRSFPGGETDDVAQTLQRMLRDLRTRLAGLADYPAFRGRTGNPLFLFPDPDGASSLKRVLLFLRWMVRREAPDLGLWTGVDPGRLLMPLDVHVFRLARRLGLTRRSSPGLSAAREITAAFRRLCPEDPLRWDFALSWWGTTHCGGGEGPCAPSTQARCPLAGWCGGGRR